MTHLADRVAVSAQGIGITRDASRHTMSEGDVDQVVAFLFSGAEYSCVK